MSRISEESLKKCPPNLRQLLALHNNVLAEAAKAINGDRSALAKFARGGKMSEEYSERIDAALAKTNGVGKGVKRANLADAEPGSKKKKGYRVSQYTGSHPLLAKAFQKYETWSDVARALGFTSPASVHSWNKDPEKFTEQWQQRVKDLLDGKELEPLVLRKHKKSDPGAGELGLAIVSVEQSDLEKIMDVAQPMGGLSVFQKRMSPTSWLVIYRFADPEDLMAFKAWASRKCDVITP
jgi:hypothetical protein